MWAGGASTLETAVFAADPVNFSRHGDNRDGFRLAAVSILYRRQRHRLDADALALPQCQPPTLQMTGYRVLIFSVIFF